MGPMPVWKASPHKKVSKRFSFDLRWQLSKKKTKTQRVEELDDVNAPAYLVREFRPNAIFLRTRFVVAVPR